MEIDNLMVMPYIDEHTDWEEQDRIWAIKEDVAWEDIRDNNFEGDL